MNNYEYIIASLPLLSENQYKSEGENSEENIIEFIIDNCSSKDKQLINILLSGYEESNLNKDFYENIFAKKNDFLKRYFTLDLNIRNCKVNFINKELKREEGKDIFLQVPLNEEENQEIVKIFENKDLLSREKEIDDFIWNKIDEYNQLKNFDFSIILGFIIKLKIVVRWLKLDPKTGKERLNTLVKEVRGTFNGVKLNQE